MKAPDPARSGEPRFQSHDFTKASYAGPGSRSVSRAFIGACCCALLFLTLAWVIEAGALQFADRQVELDIHADAPGSLRGLMSALSFIGASWPMAVITLVASLLCLRRYSTWAAGFVAVCPAGASLLDTTLKSVFHRHRPHLWPHAAILHSYSFPSGHATISAAFFGGATYVAWKLMGPGIGKPVAAIACLLVVGIGFSRVYLGVHWPSDVIAGYALGLGWVLIVIVISESLPRRIPSHPPFARGPGR